MPTFTVPSLPAINLDQCTGWMPQDIDLYNALPAWFVEREVMYRKSYGNLSQVMGSIPWEPNKGSVITGIISEPPPVLRQFAFPQAVATACAKRDVVQYRERTFQYNLRHQKFESPEFQWLPNFQDFVKNKIAKNLDFVLKWQEDFTSLFYRGFMFHQSPAIMFCDHVSDVIVDPAPVGDGNDAGTSGKSNAFLQALIPGISSPGNLTISNLFRALSYMEEDALAVPFTSGSVKEDSFLNDKFLLYTSNEVWNQFINDPYLKDNRACDLNIVTDGFKGSLLGRITTRTHSNPLRIYVDPTTGEISFPAPEAIQENPSAPNYGQTVRNCWYSRSQFEVSFLIGHKPYSVVDVGAPPSEFAASGPDRISSLKWNGKPRLTDRINVPCGTDADDNTIYDPNSYDEYLKIISLVLMGIAPETTRNCLPIVHKRARAITQSLQ